LASFCNSGKPGAASPVAVGLTLFLVPISYPHPLSVSLLRVAKQRHSMIKHHEQLAEQFFSGNGATYDQIASFSTLGLDSSWKRKILDKIPKTSKRIIEQASGTGILTCKIARLFPKCQIIGVELHEEYVNIAGKKARDLQLTNVEFIHGRAEEVILDGEFDCIASAYLAKYVDLDLLVAHARKMLREGGVLIMHELTRPTNSVSVGLWKMHFKFLQTYGKWKYPEWDIAFRDLPLLLTKTQWVAELTHALIANKFLDIKVEYLIFGASAIVSARK
jgi:demethylmenaquinone methyltransferase/2-methoxy-6-polyprenyl-1,4-benzoquinol methylase